MKFTGLLLLFSFVAHFSWAQSFSDTSSVWNYHWKIMIGPWQTSTFTIGGDTMINGLQYRKLFPSGYAVREDTSAQQVFYYDIANGFEFVAYDYSLSLGDTFSYNTSDCLGWFQMTVYAVDSVALTTGEYRKRLYLTGGNSDIWIEGIGSANWPLLHELHCVTDTYYELLCYTDHDTLQYMDQTYQTCYHNTISVSEENLNKMPFISPNIFSDFTILNSYGNSGLRLTIFDLTGKLVRDYSVIGTDRLVIERGNLLSGVYTFRIDSDDQFIKAGKLIVF